MITSSTNRGELAAVTISTLTTGILIYLFFDHRVDMGGDNAAYVVRAYELLEKGSFPGFQGPLYPLIIAPIIYFLGLDIIILKSVSGVFLVISNALLVKAFYRAISIELIMGSFFCFCFCSDFLFFGSETYSESLYLLIQSTLIFVISKSLNNKGGSANSELIWLFVVALVCLCLGLTRSIGYSSFIAVSILFILLNRWKSMLYFAAWSFFLYAGYKIVLFLLFRESQIQFSSQASQLWLIDPYNATRGNEDFFGFFLRFYENMQFYLGTCLANFLGFGEISSLQKTLVSVLVLASVTLVFFVSRKKHQRLIMFVSIYLIISLVIEFFILQTFWQQFRLVITFYPLILICVLYSVNHLLKRWFSDTYRFTTTGLIFLLLLSSTLVKSHTVLIKKRTLSSSYAHGDRYAGYTPDIENFIRMSEYAGKRLNDSLMIASRKPALSFLYGERAFGGVFRTPYSYFESLDTTSVILLKYSDLAKILTLEGFGQLRKNIRWFFFGFDQQKKDDFYRSETLYVGLYLSKSERRFALAVFDKLGFSYDFSLNNHQKYLSKIEYVEPDRLFKNLKSKKLHFILAANFRLNPGANDGAVIGTIRRQILYIQLKYPDAFTLVHTIGEKEVAELYKINYNYFEDKLEYVFDE